MGEYKNKSIKRRLEQIHRELTTPHADCLVALREDGEVKWMGKEYKTKAELDKALKYYGVTSSKPLVIVTRIKKEPTFAEINSEV